MAGRIYLFAAAAPGRSAAHIFLSARSKSDI